MNKSIRQRLLRVAFLLSGSMFSMLAGFLIADSIPRSSNALIVSWTMVAAGAFSALVGLLQIRRISGELNHQIEQLTLSAGEMSRGNLERKIPAEQIPLPEIQNLAVSINAMADRARTDITEMKRLERVRSEFLGNVSHELRTPIFSVQGYLETLIDGAINDPNVCYDFLDKAHHNVLRLHTLLNDLIEISRIESGDMKMSFRYFDADSYFRSVVEELRPTAEMAGITLNFIVTGGKENDSSILGDRERLKQVVVNLIENAIKYNRPDGTVTVELDLQNGDAYLRVRDTGIGIPKEDMGRIFERFYRVNKDRSRAVGGSGLGLAIVKHILEAHGTQAQVESKLGVGTIFSFRLKR